MSSPDHAAQRAVLGRLDTLERQESVLYAAKARALAQACRVWADDPGGMLLEVAGTCRVGQHRAGGELDRRQRLVTLFPIALGLLEAGVMRVGTVQILLAVSKNTTAEVQQLLDTRLSERVSVLDAVDVRRLVAATVPELEAELDPEAQRHRLEQARANRGVWVKPVEDGMARIGAEVDQLSARRFSLDLAELVRAQKVLDDRTGVRRTKAQREADVLVELPSRLLALADATSRGRLEQLLGEGAVLPVPLPLPVPRAAADAVPCPDELPLGLAPAAPPRWWQRPPEELVRAMLTVPLHQPVMVNVHIPMTTLLDLDQRSGWLEGIGPVPALRARMLLPTATLRRVAVDPVTGVPLGLDPLTGPVPPWPIELDPPDSSRHHPHTRRRTSAPPADAPPTAQERRQQLLELLSPPMYLTDQAEPRHDPSRALREQVQVRDQACDGPGCPRPATASELDHETDYALGGQTAEWNLRHRSTRCHHAKHTDWTVTHDPNTAISTWTSPAGSRYERRSPWQPPTQLPDDLDLPEPRLVRPLNLPPDRYDTDPDTDTDQRDRPLWPAPQARTPSEPRRARGIDPERLDEHGHIIPEPSRPEGVDRPGWDDGPPPF